MAMDTAMTNNWHQPVQSIGSSKGDGIVFKHKAVLVFNNKASTIPIDPTTDYDIILPLTEEDQYPDRYPLRMAMLIAQHSASIPDEYSITYTPTSKWSEAVFGQQCKKGDEGVNALLRMGMSGGGGYGGGGKKRMRMPDSPAASSVASAYSTSSLSPGVSVVDVIPKWVMNGFINALHRVSMGTEILSVNNFKQRPSNLDSRGMPEIAQTNEYAGDSFDVSRIPCIVTAALDGVVTTHKKNSSFLWVAKKAKISSTGEKLVYMKCWDPDCQNRVKATGGPIFDHCGWALLDKRSMAIIDRS